MEDEVSKELWQVKEEIAAEHNHDIKALFAFFKSAELAYQTDPATFARYVVREGGVNPFPSKDPGA
ncbi:MAG: hypothetical protein JNK74_08410 [Candidatus Hydrogenedentes bacterium]|nr:hypothetical protein [Candidatus Hydrogenedentota bacterium]